MKRYNWLKLKEKLRRKVSSHEHEAKIINTEFGMNITFEVVEGKDKGHTFSVFYTSFEDVGSARKELLKWVFTESGKK